MLDRFGYIIYGRYALKVGKYFVPALGHLVYVGRYSAPLLATTRDSGDCDVSTKERTLPLL